MTLPKATAEKCREALTRRYSEWCDECARITIDIAQYNRALISELDRIIAAGDAVPAGWKLVPVKPTEAMIEAGWIDKEDVNPDEIYHAMLSASPTPPVAAGDDETRRTPCCGYEWQLRSGDPVGPIYWNPYNNAVQCHNCGQAFVSAAGDETREAIRNAALEFAEAGNDTTQKAAWQKLNNALTTLIAAGDPREAWQPTHQHYKGGLYRVLFEANDEARFNEQRHVSDPDVVVYEDEARTRWVRDKSLFYGTLPDGRKRFAALTTLAGRETPTTVEDLIDDATQDAMSDDHDS